MVRIFASTMAVIWSACALLALVSCGGMFRTDRFIGVEGAISGSIVFDSERGYGGAGGDGSRFILRYTPDGAITQLTSGDGNYSPAVSPDGLTIAFSQGSSLWCMDANGENQRKLVDGSMISHPAWSPDGSTIAYGFDGKVAVVGKDGANPRIVAAAIENAHPSWSPDGTKIAYEEFTGAQIDLFFVGPDGSGVTAITQTSDTHETRPEWSPDGTRIAYQARELPSDSPTHIWIQAEGADALPLTGGIRAQGSPTWSPDGTKIAYRQDDGIWVTNADGTGTRSRVTLLQWGESGDVNQDNPDWSGGTFAFTVSASTPTVTVEANSPSTMDVVVKNVGAMDGTVDLTLSGVVPGLAAVGPTPDSVSVSVGQSATARITVVAEASLSGTSIPLTILGTAGGASSSASISINVTSPAGPDFTLSVSPLTAEAAVGDLRLFTVTATLVNGTTVGDIWVSIDPSPPAGLILRYSPDFHILQPQLSPTGQDSGRFSLENTSLTTPQSLPFTVTATDRRGITKTANVNLVIPP